MTNTVAIFKRELKSYFSSSVGFVFIIFYILVSNSFFFFVQDFFKQGQVTMRYYFAALPWIFLFFVPAVTMRLWAEEKKLGTLEVLLTMPLREVEVVLGKFLASFVFILVALLCSMTIPISLIILGQPDVGVMVGSYVGALLLGAAYLAIGLYISSLAENQVVAFIISLAVIFCLLLTGVAPVYLNQLGAFAQICEYVSLLSHFNNVTRGVIDSRDVIYYLSVIALFLWLNVKNIEARKWR
jgi:ABC-2 type transport system permease protein